MDTTAVGRLTGAKDAVDEKETVFKVSVPRKDLSVLIAGVKMSPPMGLTSWAAFKRDGKDEMVMGDLVLLQNQVSPVMARDTAAGSLIGSRIDRILVERDNLCYCTQRKRNGSRPVLVPP